MFPGVTLHKLYDTIESYEEGKVIGIFESKENQLDFNMIKTHTVNSKHGRELGLSLNQVGELQDRNPKLTENDPVVDFRHVTISGDSIESS